jgi:hypothetical protein
MDLDVMILYFNLGDPEWVQQAACREPEPGDHILFFSPEVEGTPTGEELGRVKSEGSERDLLAKTRYCSLCPSRSRCATEGWADDYGIWGGWAPYERRRIDKGEYTPARVRGVGGVSKRREEAVRLVRSGLSIEDTAIKMGVIREVVASYLRANWTVVTESDNQTTA